MSGKSIPAWGRIEVDRFLEEGQSFTPMLEVEARRVPSNRTWDGPHGSVLSAKTGDWLLTDGRSEWVVTNEIFQSTYEKLTGLRYKKTARVRARRLNRAVLVNTIEGRVEAWPGDWVVQNPSGDYWPIRHDDFTRRYRLS